MLTNFPLPMLVSVNEIGAFVHTSVGLVNLAVGGSKTSKSRSIVSKLLHPDGLGLTTTAVILYFLGIV